jgi:shikimate kinase
MERPEVRGAWPGAVRVWLRVKPSTALARLAEGRMTRPLLAGPDPLTDFRELLDRRASAYALAEHVILTDGRTPREVVARIREVIGL